MWLQWRPSLLSLPVNLPACGWVTLSRAPSLIILQASLRLPPSIRPPSFFSPASNLSDRQLCPEQSSCDGRPQRSEAQSAEQKYMQPLVSSNTWSQFTGSQLSGSNSLQIVTHRRLSKIRIFLCLCFFSTQNWREDLKLKQPLDWF